MATRIAPVIYIYTYVCIHNTCDIHVYIYTHSLTSTCSIYINIDTEIDEYIHEEKGHSKTIKIKI